MFFTLSNIARLLSIMFLLWAGVLTAHSQEMHTRQQTDLNLRSMQLLGVGDSAVSFSIHRSIDTSYPTIARSRGARVAVAPLSLVQQFNTHHPFGWNDGPMISANGYQLLFSAGIQASSGPVTIQLQPELVLAANAPYAISGQYGTNTGKTYTKIFPGQSTIEVAIGNTSVGVSSASMWWGPGIHSALLMSNNAPGFPHVYFQSRKPVKTAIGSFEWQLSGGWLSSDSAQPFENANLRHIPSAGRRYLNGLVLSYQPKWVPGLFVGFTRAIQTYAATNAGAPAGFFERYFPVFALAFQKKNVQSEDSLNRDQLASLFLRWMFPRAHFEVYAEYGFNDYGVNFRDYLLGPSHSAAYVVGFRKIIPRTGNRRVEIGLELTQMSQSPDWMVRDAGNWYVHGQITEGYTNQNQILGAGAGYGANALNLSATWVNPLNRLGFLLERINRDPVGRPVKWIDLGLGVAPQWRKGNFALGGLVEIIKTKGYLWEANNSIVNLHTRLSVQYFIK